MKKNILSVHDIKTYTTVELLYKLANQTIENTAIIEYLINDGVDKEIAKQILKMYEDGELHDLLNEFLVTKTNHIVNVCEYGELTQANYNKNGKWYQDEDCTIESEDISTVLQNCFSSIAFTDVSKVFIPKGNYILKQTIKIPFWIDVDFGMSTIYPTLDGQYTNNFMILINSSDGVNVSKPFGGSDYCTIENIVFKNHDNVDGVKAIFQGSSGTLQRIRTEGFYNTITRANEYLDFTRIHNIECAIPRGNDYQIMIPNVGDALEISRCHMWGWETEGDVGKNHIYVMNSQGGEIKNIINGRIHVNSCNGMGLYNIHLEEGNIISTNSSITIENGFLHRKDYCCPIIVRNNQTESAKGYTKNVNINNVVVFFYDGRYTKGFDYPDIDIKNSGVQLNGFYRSWIPKSGDLSSGCLLGCVIKNNGGVSWKAQHYPLAAVNSYIHPNGLELPYTTPKNNEMESTEGVMCWTTTNVNSTLTGGTYRYIVVYYDDLSRQLGFWSNTHESNPTITTGQGVLLELPQRLISGRMIRIYRGKQGGSPTHYIDIPYISGKYLIDSGDDICGYPWKTYTGFADFNAHYTNLIVKGSNVECHYDSIPQHGNWVSGDKVYNTNIATGQVIGWVYNGNSWVSLGKYA